MARCRMTKLVVLVTAAAICGCTGTGPGAPPLEQMALFPLQMIALPFMILKPFAPLIQAGMQAGMQMAPYALLFCQSETGPSERIFAERPGGEEGLSPSLPLIEAFLAKNGGVEGIAAVDLVEIGGADGLPALLSALEKNGIRCRWVIVDAADILRDEGSLHRLRDLLLGKGVSLYTTGRLSAAVSGRFGPEYVGFPPDDSMARAWSEAALFDTGA